MSKFTYMNFTGGYSSCEFVAHANKYTKEQTIELCLAENDWQFEDKTELRKPTISDIRNRYVRWYIQTPDWCGYNEEKGGCYTYCGKDEKGAFPVWVINFEDLAVFEYEAWKEYIAIPTKGAMNDGINKTIFRP